MTPNADYRLYYLDATDRIVSAEDLTAESDAAAIDMARARCNQHPVCAAVELWQGARRVHYYRRTGDGTGEN